MTEIEVEIDEKLLKALEEIVVERNISKEILIEEILKEYIEKIERNVKDD